MKYYTLKLDHPKLWKEIKTYSELSYEKKKELMDIKCSIDKIPNRDWELSKKVMNDYEYIYTSSRTNKNICGIVPVSRSYFKLYEILQDTIGIRDNGYAACIAEGPGGFIHCLNDHTKKVIYGITLISQSNKSIPFWNQQIISNLNNKLFYGENNSGDIYQLEISKGFINYINNNLCTLITADGGFDYSNDYKSPEDSSYRLIFSEIYIALNIQENKGNFIIKMFDLFNYKTIQLLYILYICYDKITIHKPSTSRRSNSEKYVICSCFNGCNSNILKIMERVYDKPDDLILYIPDSFIKEIMEYNDIFINNQISSIKGIIKDTMVSDKDKTYPTQNQVSTAKEWCKKYNLPLNNKCTYL